MTLTERARERLADVVALQPTKNAELGERWGLENGSDVHTFLEEELGDFYYRDDNGLIRATEEAVELVDVEPGISDEDGDGFPDRIRVPPLEARIFETLAGPNERSQSVVSLLKKLRATDGTDQPTPSDDDERLQSVSADEVRSALQSLQRKGVVETVYRTVPTYRRTIARSTVTVEVTDSHVA